MDYKAQLRRGTSSSEHARLLLHKKTKEMSDQLSDIDLNEKELAKEPL